MEEAGDALATMAAYIDLSPVRAELVGDPGFVTPITFEEPNIAGVFAVGFDAHPRNDVSVHPPFEIWAFLELCALNFELHRPVTFPAKRVRTR